VKKLRRKTLAQDFLTKDEVLKG